MSERSPLTPDPVADALARFTPVGVDRDELMFRAGQAAVRPPRGWKVATGLLAVSQAVTLGFLLARGPAPTVSVAVPPPPPASVEVPPPPPSPVPEVAPPPRPAPKPWRDPPPADPDGYDRPPAVAGGGRFLPYSYGALMSAAADRAPPPPARSATGPDLPPISVRSWERVRVEE